jgi:capsid protein
VYKWSTAKAIKRGDLTENAEWYKAVYQTPKRISIDVGRDSNADREDYFVGMRSLADLAGERGDDWQEIIRQKAMEAKFMAEVAKEYGVEVSQIQSNKNEAPKPVIAPK